MSDFYGLYKGICTNNVDPENLYRIKAIVPQVFGNETTETDWAWPVFPWWLNTILQLTATGSTFTMQDPQGGLNTTPRNNLVGNMTLIQRSAPDPTTGVWIGFEGGDEDYPYWSGVWCVSEA